MLNLTKVAISGIAVLALSAWGGGTEGPSNSYSNEPTIVVDSIDVEDGGSKLRWNVDIDNQHENARIKIEPWNDSTYFWHFADIVESYGDDIELECNSEVAENGYVSYNEVKAVVCDRGLMGSDYSEFTCNIELEVRLSK